MIKTKHVGFFTGPVIFFLAEFLLPETIFSAEAIHVLAIGGWLVTWWVTEATHSSVTALLPLVLFPAFGVMNIAGATAPYANPVIFLFMGGFMIALALEKHRLHERIALNLIRITGTSGNGIILGFTLSTGILSMWISNTATALMMLPIAISVVELLRKPKSEEGAYLSKNEKNFALGLMLCIGYSASIGGIGTIIGTPPNVVFAGFMKQMYDQDLDFGKWMLVGVPVAMITLMVCYFLITRVLFPNHMKSVSGSKELIASRLKELGSIKKEERLVLLIFSITSFLWIFQTPINNNIIQSEALNDTNIAITGGLLMFLMPTNFRKGDFILEWDDTKRLPWGILILFGGGICLAKGMEITGIVKLIGDTISGSSLSFFSLVLILISISLLLTEIMSNVALITIFVPVVFGIADGLGLNPIVVGMPVTFAASCAFMFPVSTPPNAIVFSSGHIKMREMVRAGVLLDLASIVIIMVSTMTIIQWVYG